jgi:hypothetical protein
MPTVNLPDDPTPEILDAITAGLFAPLAGDRDKQRERAIYRRILRATSTAPTKTVWEVEGSQHLTEPPRTIVVNHEEEIGRACTTLLADGFPRARVRATQVPA